MPSASAKLEKQTSLEVLDPLKQVLTIVEKKLRNLEKRKGRLDLYKTEFSQGKELNEDQKNAVSRYDEVLQSLDVMKELQKQFLQIATDSKKVTRKQTKRDQVEKQAHDTKRIRDILKIQDVLCNLRENSVRNDFLTGENGAVLLSDEKLDQLDKLFKLITPSRTSEEGKANYKKHLLSAPEHLLCLLDGKKKPVLGTTTTFKDLKELIFKIHDCGYFKKGKPEPEVDVDREGDSQSCENQFEEVEEEVAVERIEEDDSRKHQIPKEDEDVIKEDTYDDGAMTRGQHQDSGLVTPSVTSDDNSVFSTFTHNRPYTEVISGSQGSFNFLQESQIDLDSPHMDPAVVAAHPRVPPSVRPFPSSQQVDSFTSQYHHGSEEQPTARVQSPIVVQTSQPAAVYVQPVPQIPTLPPSEFSQIPTQTFTNQSYVALQTYDTQVYGQGTPQQVPQAVSSASAVIGLIGSEPVSVMSEPKKHFMNVNATAFESAVTFNSIPTNITTTEQETSVEDTGEHVPEDENQYTTQGDNQAPGSYPRQSLQGGFQVKYGARGNGRGAGRGARGTTNGYGNRGGNRQSGGGTGGGGNNGGGPGAYSNSRSSGNYQGYRDGNNYYQSNYQKDNAGNQANYGSGFKRGTFSGARGGPRGNLRGNPRGGYGKSGQ